MKGKPNYYGSAIKILQSLKKNYPNQTLGQHIGTAIADYQDPWSITDKEFHFALEKYQNEMEMNICSDLDTDKIIKEGLNLDTILNEDEDDF